MDANPRAEKFMALFAGSKAGYYVHRLGEVNPETGKRDGKYQAVRQQVTSEQWRLHLSGTAGNGLLMIPIDQDDKAQFGAIDIDEGYGGKFDHAGLAKKIEDLKLPLYLFKSKSGGAHLYLFLKTPIAAGRVIDVLKDYVGQLGLDETTEIFPKQRKLIKDGRDLGNGINMPYFGTTRQCVTTMGEVGADDFLDLVSQTDPKDLKATERIDLEASPLGKEAPPCLQALTQVGFPPGTRANGLFDLAVFATKAFPDEWEAKVWQYQKDYCPSQSGQEVASLVKSVGEKFDKNKPGSGYSYRCDEQPIKPFCDNKLCRQRKFGVDGGSEPVIESVTVYRSQDGETFWKLISGGVAIGFKHDEFIDETKFIRVFSEAMLFVPSFTRGQFKRMINNLMRRAEEQEVDFAATRTGQVQGLIWDFVHTASGVMPEAVLDGMVFRDDDGGRFWFRISALEEYIASHNVRGWTATKLIDQIRVLKGGGVQLPKGISVGCWWLPIDAPAAETMDPAVESQVDFS